MQMMDIQSYKHAVHTQAKERHIKQQQIFFKEKNEKKGDLNLVHVVWDFRPWNVMIKVRYFSMLHFQFSGSRRP